MIVMYCMRIMIIVMIIKRIMIIVMIIMRAIMIAMLVWCPWVTFRNVIQGHPMTMIIMIITYMDTCKMEEENSQKKNIEKRLKTFENVEKRKKPSKHMKKRPKT